MPRKKFVDKEKDKVLTIRIPRHLMPKIYERINELGVKSYNEYIRHLILKDLNL